MTGIGRGWSGSARLVGALAALWLCALPQPAAAFKLLQNDGGANPHWSQATIAYRVVYDVAPPEPAASQKGTPLGDRIAAAMKPWTEVQCPRKDGPLPVGFTFVQTAPPEVATCPNDTDGMRRCLGGDGVVRVISDPKQWPLSDLTVGYTILASEPSGGISSRFTLLMNDATYDFCDFDCDGKAFDVGTVILHEAGHVLGLDHTDVKTAVMVSSRSAAEILRTLHADDREGLCTMYPVAAAPADDGGCTARRPGAKAGAGWWWSALLALLALWAARLRSLSTGLKDARAGAGLFVLVLLSTPQPALAWNAAQTASGADQRWYVPELTLELDDTGLAGQGLPDAAVEAATLAALRVWVDVPCALCQNPDGPACAPVQCASHPLGVTAKFGGWKPPRPPGLGCTLSGDVCRGEPDGNQVLFLHDAARWPVASHVIALTLVAADVTTGAIGDADVLVNAAFKQFCAAPDCKATRYDLQNTLAHEFGHLFGLDHSTESAATMYGGAPPLETHKRDLHADDVVGVCTLYRRAFVPTGCQPQPEPEGCSAARGSRSMSPVALGVLALSVALLGAVRGGLA